MIIKSIKQNIPLEYKSTARRVFKNFCDSFIYAFIRKKPKTNYENIIFVCKGNICRSAFAEQYFKKSQPLNVNSISCGLDVDEGCSSPEKAIQVAAEFDIDMANTVSKNITAIRISNGALIVAMEFDQYKRLVQEYPHHKKNIFLLKDFLPWPKRLQCNIADPYGGEDRDFRYCFRTIKNILDYMMVQKPDSRSDG